MTPSEARKERNLARVEFEQATAALKKARKRFEHTERQYQAITAKKPDMGQVYFDRATAILDERGYDWGVEWYVCLRKVLHVNLRTALDAVRIPGAEDMSPYVCIYCSGWHVGHSPKYTDGLAPAVNKIAARMADKLKRGHTI